jgi:hypothetical protein
MSGWVLFDGRRFNRWRIWSRSRSAGSKVKSMQDPYHPGDDAAIVDLSIGLMKEF